MLTSFSLRPEVIQLFPDAQIRFVSATGLDNKESWPAASKKLEDLEARLATGEWQPYGEDDPAVQTWHEAFRRFGTNPRRFRPSLDALSRRLAKTGKMPRINSAVDAYNLVSVLFGVPAGAFDRAALADKIEIRIGEDGDVFVPLGEPDVAEHPTAGEVVYAQGNQVLTRHWNHRDSDLSKVTPDSTSVVFILERISSSAVSNEQIAAAQLLLAQLVQAHAEDITLAVIEAETPHTDLTKNEPGSAI